MDRPLQPDFGQRLQAIRLAFSAVTGQPDMKMAKFGALLDLEPETYRRYERGETLPPCETLAKLRALTGISLDYLVCDLDCYFQGVSGLADLAGPCRATFPQRVRWARQLFTADPAEVAEALGVSAELYHEWETGLEPMPLEMMRDFAHSFSVSLDYLLRGLPNGIAPHVLKRLLEVHPDLWRAPDSDRRAASDTNHPNGNPVEGRRRRTARRAQ